MTGTIADGRTVEYMILETADSNRLQCNGTRYLAHSYLLI